MTAFYLLLLSIKKIQKKEVFLLPLCLTQNNYLRVFHFRNKSLKIQFFIMNLKCICFLFLTYSFPYFFFHPLIKYQTQTH